ncbi:Hypothetical protein MSYG_3441 [Malassezia sympodialis ATCC 42132]|uniref:Uncharacterized protein n=1 Tax=Malassezia sympodialis (strain ATCC 42132) TaxID=1230383 RepID=A0A1M8A9G8_MALS4|nr:Hypothetical protein MSYG_3441 [Malassezia sympodialis ATCC 42132]
MHAWAAPRTQPFVGGRAPWPGSIVLGRQVAGLRARAAPAPTPTLWTPTLPRPAYRAFLRDAMRLMARTTRTLEQVVAACAPVPSWVDHVHKREELQCVLLEAALRARVPLPRLEQLCTVQAQPPAGVPPPLLAFRRAMLFRAFTAQLQGQRFVAAAQLLGDARLRPSQTTYMLRQLLQALRTPSAAPLTSEPTHSPRAALREACERLATVAQRRGAVDERVFLGVLRELSRRHMHTHMAPWARVCAPLVRGGPTLAPQLAEVVRRVATRHGAAPDAAMLVMALPPPWRTPSMLHTLLLYLDEEPSPQAGAATRAVWDDVRSGLGPLLAQLHTHFARLRVHASRASARAAWHEWRALEQLDAVPDALRAQAALLVVQTLSAAGRLSLAMRLAERRAPSVLVAHGTAALYAMLRSVLQAAQTHGQSERRTLLSHMYECVLRAAAQRPSPPAPDHTRALQLRERMPCMHGPPAVPSSAVVHALLAHVSRLVDTYALRPDLATLQLLVRTATQWNTAMDSRALWHMADLALPRVPGPRPPVYRALLCDLAAALERRHDRASARHARALARRCARRVRRPLAREAAPGTAAAGAEPIVGPAASTLGRR